ncbi:MAG: CoA-acylating methylmalonate-semialdehyde dehydrogenase [Ilumatobacter sp.]|uniref:CoA-acylating methylmalonate-semialdehyde dehydrogenase n=2 Tax=Ilumatobacter sp. TaxID=1967498 RepID=UPI001D5964A1|nr:CoA-acylating methylmalonate-semialdehyde dehydrogenase [Ilumatobacter sp.]MBT5276117.1 CoA-acylating methylmalonate-semialdehyde dehydrogenase [Ilumatobacter sp.]MBT5864621.1 CoA-acylating methylmalonate-semialdehyde dehydrogenase [Ilumatobacter sp.]MBT7429699.1 CoA-acylating methylmalonate-semialdehyde dehydrogenase [Ilumatobacter sp.]MDG1391399.1 CoA-acylating methylmalonate-semialdehyde dehydrogenase [Ilumatobacter sp.]
MNRISHWIDGRVVASTSGNSAPVYDPATGTQTGAVDLASIAEVDAAVAAAAAAFPAWRSTSLSRRAEVLFRMRELVDANRKEIAMLLTAEHGKVLSDSLGEVARGLENIEFACGVPQLIKGDYSEQAATGVDVYSIRQPLGVVAGITPFNFPAMVPMWMFANALACGNTFVLKPSEKDPSVTMFIAELLSKAGLPDGCFNIVQGDKVAVDRLLEHDDVQAVSFVGSTPIAKYIYETGTSNGKRVQALGGAKNHMLVLADADISMAADAAVSAAYGSAGERCMAISVVLAADGIADELVDAIADRIPKIKVGNGMESDSEMGPLITAESRDRVVGYIDGAPNEGATVVVDGRESVPAEGYFVNPTLLDNVTTEMASYRDEIFGPVLGVMRVSGFEEGIDIINANQYANGTAIFTRDGGAARQFQFDVQVGMVGVNVPVPVPVSYYSFGGWKASLFGDTHMYGPEGINFYTRAKVVTSRWPDPATSSVDLGFPETR